MLTLRLQLPTVNMCVYTVTQRKSSLVLVEFCEMLSTHSFAPHAAFLGLHMVHESAVKKKLRNSKWSLLIIPAVESIGGMERGAGTMVH